MFNHSHPTTMVVKFIQMNHHHPPVIMTPHTQCEGIYYDPAGVYVIFKQLGQPI